MFNLDSKETKLSQDTVKRVLQRLVNKKLVEKRMGDMPEDIPPFEQGDFVIVKENLTNQKDKDESIKALSVGVYKIATIKGEKKRCELVSEEM